MSESGYYNHGKRPANDGDYNEEDSKRRKLEPGDGPLTLLRFLVQSRDAGGVIGKAGNNINRLRREYKATVNIPDSKCPERIFTIHASLGSALTVLGECMPKICETALRQNPRQDPEVHMLIHQSHAGTIIGRAGQKIKGLRETTQTNIKIFPDCLPESTERIVAIKGNTESILHAVQLISNEIDDIPTKGSVYLYEPGSQYQGGFGDDDGGGRHDVGRRDVGRSDGGRRDGGRRDGGRRDGGRRDGGRRDGNRYSGRSQDYDDNNGGNYDRNTETFGNQMPGDLLNNPFAAALQLLNQGQLHSTTSSQVTIPKDLAGAIIGPGGNRIKRIRRDTGANIMIAEPVGDSNDRVITIVGDQDQINHSQYLMQKCVREYSGSKKY